MRRMLWLVIAVALVVSSCRGDAPVADNAVRAALAKTRLAGTARYALVVTISRAGVSASAVPTPESLAREEIQVSGVWDMARGRVRTRVTYAASAAGAAADYVVIGRTVYAGGPAAPGGKWRVFAESDAGVGKDSLGVLRPDPALEIAAGSPAEVTRVGARRIGGRPTTLYRARVDVSRAAREADPAGREALAARALNSRRSSADIEAPAAADTEPTVTTTTGAPR